MAIGDGGMAWAEEPARFTTSQELPYQAHWGPYTVTVVALSRGEQRFRVSSQEGEVLREIRAPFINLVDYPDLDGRGQFEFLRVITHPRQNTLADIRTYCFTRRGGLRNVLAMPYGFDSAHDLDGDGRPELISDSPAPLEWTAGLSHGCGPSVSVVLRWDGKRYVVANRRYRELVRTNADVYRESFLKAVQRYEKPEADAAISRDEILGAALGYWANLATIGEEAKAQEFVAPKLPPGMREHFLGSFAEVRERLAKVPATIQVNQRRSIKDGE
jgi:hypothetical protein